MGATFSWWWRKLKQIKQAKQVIPLDPAPSEEEEEIFNALQRDGWREGVIIDFQPFTSKADPSKLYFTLSVREEAGQIKKIYVNLYKLRNLLQSLGIAFASDGFDTEDVVGRTVRCFWERKVYDDKKIWKCNNIEAVEKK